MNDDRLIRKLPGEVPAPAGMRTAPLEIEPVAAPVALSHYLWLLRRHAWRILFFVAASVGAAVIVSSRLTPIYESTATVDIDRHSPPGIVGQEASDAGPNDADQFLATQIKLIESDSVLRPVVEKYKLHEAEASGASGDPSLALSAPVILKKLRITRPPNTYLLQISYRSPDPWLAANVANGIANSYLEHTYQIRFSSAARLSQFMEKQLEELKAKMERSSEALAQFERELNVIDPEQKTNIVSARLLQLNTEYTVAQADRVRKEASYRMVKEGALQALNVSPQGDALNKLTDRLEVAQQKFAEVKTHYGVNHPEYRKSAAEVAELQAQIGQTTNDIARRVEVQYQEALSREAMLQKSVADTKAEFDQLNARSFEYQARKREADADKQLYEELDRKIKEAGINAGFQNSAIRIADAARPGRKPVFPNIPLNALLAFLTSSLVGFGAIVLGDALNSTVRDPEQVARMLNVEVVGGLPAVRSLRARIVSQSSAPEGSHGLQIWRGPARKLQQYDQAVHTLRNSVLLGAFDRRPRSVMITSAAPFEGKSTIAAQLAAAHAQTGHKTLLIDGDVRRPSIHRNLGLEHGRGLAEVLAGETSWQDVVRRNAGTPNLDVLLGGSTERRIAELFGPRLRNLIEEAARQYDLVVLDSPPLLGFPEPMQMAISVDGVLLVALAGQTRRKALAATVATLTRLRAHVLGVVLNQIKPTTSEGYYHAYYHPKYYKGYTG